MSREAERSVRCRVSGRVQGVHFRAATAMQARRLGLRGQVRNLPDGGVEVIAGGRAGAVAALIDWLQRGPPLARVDAVACEDIAGATLDDPFEVHAG